MHVCEECHEKDKNVTNCKRRWRFHPDKKDFQCEICGKPRHTVSCFNYELMKKPDSDPLRVMADRFAEMQERRFQQIEEHIKTRKEVKHASV